MPHAPVGGAGNANGDEVVSMDICMSGTGLDKAIVIHRIYHHHPQAHALFLHLTSWGRNCGLLKKALLARGT